ncbi:MAG: hypothetical protein Q7T34_00870 [Candidatus Parcubacteria bacterium]|nr:hypothetical protein [Candidatus Parcubacteria bacterium]
MNNKQPKKASLPGTVELLKRTWQIYKEKFLVLTGIMLIPFTLRIIFGASSIIFTGTVSFVLVIIGVVLSLFFAFWASLAVIYAVGERNHKGDIKESFLKPYKKIGRLGIVSILTLLIVLGGFIFLIIPGIIFSIWYGFSMFIAIFEDTYGMKALSRSKKLVSGYAMDVFLKYFAGGLIVLVIVLIPKIITAFLLGNDLSGDIFSLFLSPFFVIYSFLIYEELKKIKGNIPTETI